MKRVLRFVLVLACLFALQVPAMADQAEIALVSPALDALTLTDEDPAEDGGYVEYMSEDGLFLVEIFRFNTTEYGMVGENAFEDLPAMLAGGEAADVQELDFANVSFYPARRVRFASGSGEDSAVIDVTAVWTQAKTFVFVVITGADTWHGYAEGYEDVPALVDGWVKGLEVVESKESAASSAYLEQMGAEINYAFGDGEVFMEAGAYVHTLDGKNYATIPLTLEMSLDSVNDTKDGFVEIEFTKTVHLDSENYPDFMSGNDWTLGMSEILCDYYTGFEFNSAVVDGDIDKGENYHYYEYVSQGRKICVEYNFSAEWFQKKDGSYILEQQTFLRVPSDYDGILYGQRKAYPDYESCVAGNTYPEDSMYLLSGERLQDIVLCRVNTME